MPVHVLCQLEVQPCNFVTSFTSAISYRLPWEVHSSILVEDTLLVAFLICNELVLGNPCFLLFLLVGFVLSLIVLRPLGQGFTTFPPQILRQLYVLSFESGPWNGYQYCAFFFPWLPSFVSFASTIITRIVLLSINVELHSVWSFVLKILRLQCCSYLLILVWFHPTGMIMLR